MDSNYSNDELIPRYSLVISLLNTINNESQSYFTRIYSLIHLLL